MKLCKFEYKKSCLGSNARGYFEAFIRMPKVSELKDFSAGPINKPVRVLEIVGQKYCEG